MHAFGLFSKLWALVGYGLFCGTYSLGGTRKGPSFGELLIWVVVRIAARSV